PLAGARLYLRYYSPKELAYPVRTSSDRDGRFSFRYDHAALDRTETDDPWVQVIAVADGYGPDWAMLGREARSEAVTLRRAKDAATRGRILDLDGKPVAGARLRVEHVHRYQGDDLTAFLQTVREGEFPPQTTRWWQGPFPGQPREIVTGADGRFLLAGVGAERKVRFPLEGPGIRHGHVRAVSRDPQAPAGPKEKNPGNKPRSEPLHGA